MYRMVISQLFYDGYQKDAMQLASTLGIALTPPPPSDKLYRLVTNKQTTEDLIKDQATSGISEVPTACLDMEYDADISPNTPEPSLYETIYLTAHKGPCRAVAFNDQGSLLATGSADCSIKILDVERILARNAAVGSGAQVDEELHGGGAHPVIRTLYDHVEEVSCVAFHPTASLLASGSHDCTLKFYDFSKAAVKRANKTIQEVEPVNCISFHPSGEYLLVATQHPTLRLYNVHTSQSWTSSVPSDQHRAHCNSVSFSSNGRLYVTGSADGDIRVWDGVSNRCIATYQRAHDGVEICSVAFTKNSKYVLSAGKDSVLKLWELGANRCLIAYTGAGTTGSQEFNQHAAFNHTEDYVMFPDEKSGHLCTWDARNADRKRLLAIGHAAVVRAFTHSPSMPAFVTCSDDFRARFWFRRSQNN